MTRHGYRPLAAIISKQYPHLRPTRAKFLISSSFHLYFIPLQNIPRRYPGPLSDNNKVCRTLLAPFHVNRLTPIDVQDASPDQEIRSSFHAFFFS